MHNSSDFLIVSGDSEEIPIDDLRFSHELYIIICVTRGKTHIDSLQVFNEKLEHFVDNEIPTCF